VANDALGVPSRLCVASDSHADINLCRRITLLSRGGQRGAKGVGAGVELSKECFAVQ
jgi:hypothetical protein